MTINSDILFEQLYDTYYDGVYRYIFAAVKDKWNTEDIISNVFTNIYRHKEKIISVEESKNWIFRIAHNAIIDFYRKNSKIIPIEEFFDNGDVDLGYEKVIVEDEFKPVKEIIDELPKETREMLYLRYYGGLKYREIAAAVETPENTVKSVISRSLKKIKKLYNRSSGGVENERRGV